MTTKMKLMALGLCMTLFTGCSSVENLIEEYLDDEEEYIDGEDNQYTSSTIYLKDSNGNGVAGISYSCDGGSTNDGRSDSYRELITSGSTSSTGGVPVEYWPGYDLSCNITPIDAPELYLYDVNGPIDAYVSCASFGGSTGEGGAINNESFDTCTISFVADKMLS